MNEIENENNDKYEFPTVEAWKNDEKESREVLVLTKSYIFKKDISKKEIPFDVLQSLLIVVKGVINTSSEMQTLEYCQTVLEKATAGVCPETVVCFFLEKLLLNDPLLKHAAIALLWSYCSGRCFDFLLASNLLKNVISLFCDDNLKILEFSWKTIDTVIQNLKFEDQMKIVSNVCLAVKWALFQSNKRYLAGLCYSLGFDSIFSLYEKVMLKGVMKDKRLAAQALRDLIIFSSEDALQPSLYNVLNVLVCDISKLENEPCTQTKITLVETLTTLLAKVDIKHEKYFLRTQETLLASLISSNRSLQLKCIRGLCCLVRFHVSRFVALYDKLINSIKKEACPMKKIQLLFTLRCITKCAPISIPKSLHHKILVLFLNMLDYQNNPCRIAAAGCFGTIVGFLPPAECLKVVNLFLDEHKATSYSLRHSQCTALMVALKESPARLLLQEELSEKISERILSFMTSEKVDIIMSGLKACGYFMLFKLSLLEEKIDRCILVSFCKAMSHTSVDVKCTFSSVTNYIANKIVLPLYVIKEIVPYLINGTKDNCSKVKSSCEFALVAVLDLYNHDKITQMYLNTLETDEQELFQNELINLKAVAKQPKPNEEELDFTLM